LRIETMILETAWTDEACVGTQRRQEKFPPELRLHQADSTLRSGIPPMATGHKVGPLAAAPDKRQAALSGKVLSCVCGREGGRGSRWGLLQQQASARHFPARFALNRYPNELCMQSPVCEVECVREFIFIGVSRDEDGLNPPTLFSC